jgi:hypothetical protein
MCGKEARKDGTPFKVRKDGKEGKKKNGRKDGREGRQCWVGCAEKKEGRKERRREGRRTYPPR